MINLYYAKHLSPKGNNLLHRYSLQMRTKTSSNENILKTYKKKLFRYASKLKLEQRTYIFLQFIRTLR